MKKIYLLRHGEPIITGRFIGASDIPLSESGKKYISSQQPLVSSFSYGQIWCSPLTRCLETLELLSLGAEVEVDSRLREINFGEWECKTFTEISSQYPDETDQWSRDLTTFCFPGGEAISTFHKRVADFAIEIAQQNKENILIISHGGVIRLLLCIFLKIPLEKYLLFNVDYCKLTIVDLHSEGGVLQGLNW